MSAHQTFSVIVRAGAKKQEIKLDESGVLRIKTSVAPEKGKANKAVVEMIAKFLGVPKSSIEIVSGHTNSRKIIKITA